MDNIAPNGFDASIYPRTYTASSFNRAVWISLGVLFVVAGLLGAWYFGTGHDVPSTQLAVLIGLVCLTFAVLGAYLVLWMLRFKVVLRADAIEVQETGSERTLLRADIAGRRLLSTQYVSTLVLTPRDKGQKKLKIGMMLKKDAAFDAWFAAIPDLDAAELESSKSQIASDPEFGVTPSQRSEQLENARTTAKWLTWVAFAASAWGMFYPRPYPWVIGILACLPLLTVALVLRSKGLYQLEGRRNDARPSLAISFLFPGIVLALRAMAGVEFLRWSPLLLWSLAGSGGMTLLIASADRRVRDRRVAIVSIFFIAMFYAFGAAAQADELFDHSDPQVFHVSVLSKRISSSSKSTRYYLRVSPWGPQQYPNEISVSTALYRIAEPGDEVCVNLLPGALKIPWYYATACR